MSSYHDGHRELQDRFDSRRLADRLEQVPGWKRDERFSEVLPGATKPRP